MNYPNGIKKSQNKINTLSDNDKNINYKNRGMTLEKMLNDTNKYLSNSKYKGFSIVDALKEINVDSSYEYRSKLAKLNGINKVIGVAINPSYIIQINKKQKCINNIIIITYNQSYRNIN